MIDNRRLLNRIKELEARLEEAEARIVLLESNVNSYVIPQYIPYDGTAYPVYP